MISKFFITTLQKKIFLSKSELTDLLGDEDVVITLSLE